MLDTSDRAVGQNGPYGPFRAEHVSVSVVRRYRPPATIAFLRGASPWNRLSAKKPDNAACVSHRSIVQLSETVRISGSESTLGTLIMFIHSQSRLRTCSQKNCRPLRSTLTVLQEWESIRSEKYYSRCSKVNWSGQQSKLPVIRRTPRE